MSAMSYNVAICTPPLPKRDEDAWQVIDLLIDQEGEPPPVFRQLYEKLTAKYPCIVEVPDPSVNPGVWSDGPLWNNFGLRVAVLGMVYSRVGEALPFVIETANSLGLTVFDWTGPVIYRPPGGRGGPGSSPRPTDR